MTDAATEPTRLRRLLAEAVELIRDYEAELAGVLRNVHLNGEKQSLSRNLARAGGVRERLEARYLALAYDLGTAPPLPPAETPEPCENCGNDREFVRYYVEEHKERLTPAGEWETVSSYEYDEGAHTYSECAVCEGSVYQFARGAGAPKGED